MTRLCSMSGCEKKHKGHDLCDMHLKRLRANGSPLIRGRKRPPTEINLMDHADRFWTKVIKRGPTECWDWTPIKDYFGFGRRSSRMPAKRFAWILTYGNISAEVNYIRRKCQNFKCVNPLHLDPIVRRARRPKRERISCPNGHALIAANTLVIGKYKRCRICHVIQQRAYLKRKKDRGGSSQSMSDLMSRLLAGARDELPV